VVDPREIELAQRADIWLRIRPGTDDALALGMLHIIISEEIYDKEFVEKWTVGFDKLAERVREYPPERVEKITGIAVEQIRKAARMFATSKPATIEWGVALEQTPNCLQTVRSVALLPGITGNIDIPGGWILGMHIFDEVPYLKENLSNEIKDKRMGADAFKILCSRKAVFPAANIPTLFNAMRTGKPYPVKAFLIFGNNGLLTYGNSKKVYESFMSLDFFTVMDIYMTPTAELADIVLPAATWLEADEVAGMPYVAFNVALVQQKVTRLYESRQPEEVFIDLAQRLDLKVDTEPLEDLFNNQLKRLGITFDELRQKGFVTKPFKYRKYEKSGFHTPSRKVELYSSVLERQGYDPLPYYQEPPESPVSNPALAKEYPLILTTGGRIQQFFNSEYRQVSVLRKQHPDPIVEINPATAQKYNIKEDDWVWIETPRGRIKQKARLNNINPKAVNVQFGWWFPEKEGPQYGVWESNANVLTNTEPPYDPAIGTYQLRALLCRIYKVE
jgi:anaerobic selenocysteine-containing dehydrogenase